jgi:hypothetical protein
MRSFFIILSLILVTSARPSVDRRASFTLKNGQDAIALKYVPSLDNLLLNQSTYFF